MAGTTRSRGIARRERDQLCELFDDVGPDAPTLCAGWTTRDLAAHLVVRERRPDAAPGILLPLLAGYTARVQRDTGQRPWRDLVELVRTGPPRWSPQGLPRMDELTNTTEFFVHHEDVRRGRPGWQPRAPQRDRDEVLWRNAAIVGQFTYRRCPLGVVLRRPDGVERTVRRGSRSVAVAGEPGELLLHAFGRDEVRVRFEGEQADVAVVQGLDRRV